MASLRFRGLDLCVASHPVVSFVRHACRGVTSGVCVGLGRVVGVCFRSFRPVSLSLTRRVTLPLGVKQPIYLLRVPRVGCHVKVVVNNN